MWHCVKNYWKLDNLRMKKQYWLWCHFSHNILPFPFWNRPWSLFLVWHPHLLEGIHERKPGRKSIRKALRGEKEKETEIWKYSAYYPAAPDAVTAQKKNAHCSRGPRRWKKASNCRVKKALDKRWVVTMSAERWLQEIEVSCFSTPSYAVYWYCYRW